MAKTPSSGKNPSKTSGKSVAADGRTVASSPKKRDSLVSLRRDIDAILTRLRQADNLTQQSVASLKTAFNVLERRMGNETHVNKAALTLRVDQLSSHLTGLIKNTQEAVAKDLRQTRTNPSMDQLKLAVAAAEKRMADTEIAQADALSKVNRHIADLAKAIDARLTQDAIARKAGFDRLTVDLENSTARIDNKIKNVELASAQAILKLGERVVAVSDEFKNRTDGNTQIVTEKISDIALKTQKEFEAYRAEIQDYRAQFERRVESLEESQRNLDSYTDRSLAGLTNRIDNLEYGLTNTAPPAVAPAIPNNSAPTETPSMGESSLLLDDPFAPDAEEAAPQVAKPHSEPVLFNPEPTPARPPLMLVPTAPAPVTPAPTLSPVPQNTPNTPHRPAPQSPAPSSNTGSFTPTEYIPKPQTSRPPAHPLTGHAHAPAAQPNPAFAPVSHTQALPDSAVTPEYFVPPDSMVVLAEEDLPYDDPAYAEKDSSDNLHRPGSFNPKKKRVKNKASKKTAAIKTNSGETGRSSNILKIAGLAAVIAAGAYIGLRTVPKFLGSGQPTFNEMANQGSPTTGAGPMSVAQGIPQTTIPPEIAPTVGDYQDNQGFGAGGTPAAVGTLEASAQNGDPVAEFQLGLSYLQAGRTSDAVELIRSSANKGQPAAQYRLAKLYEAGEGVTADPAMARQLTERAARNGNRIAMHDLALYYAEGRGDVGVDIKTAAIWFEKAAERGVVDSQYNLGVLYESGQGLPKNLNEAYVWYGIAAGQGDQYAQKQIETLKGNMSAADITKAETRVKDFKPVAIDEPANGIFRNVSWNAPSNQRDAKVQIAQTQSLLAQLGYDAGSADGSMGPKTRSAIISFQKEKGLSPTGEVNQALVNQLQQASGA
ncbi:MAG: peptidoglycan-binding protein [Alphaproteobacteria bacterium]